MEELRSKLGGITNSLQAELVKFEHGNKSAGTRARALCLEMKDLTGAIRKHIQEVKNANKGA